MQHLPHQQHLNRLVLLILKQTYALYFSLVRVPSLELSTETAKTIARILHACWRGSRVMTDEAFLLMLMPPILERFLFFDEQEDCCAVPLHWFSAVVRPNLTTPSQHEPSAQFLDEFFRYHRTRSDEWVLESGLSFQLLRIAIQRRFDLFIFFVVPCLSSIFSLVEIHLWIVQYLETAEFIEKLEKLESFPQHVIQKKRARKEEKEEKDDKKHDDEDDAG